MILPSGVQVIRAKGPGFSGRHVRWSWEFVRVMGLDIDMDMGV